MERLWPRLLAFLAVTAMVLAVPAIASAGVKSKRDKGGVSKRVAKRLHLTRAERRALDIRSVKVYAQEGMGLLVKVRFRGDVERRLGRGHLRRAAIAVTLNPKSKRRRRTVIVTMGRKGRPKLLKRSRSKNVGVGRHGRTLRFFIQGTGASSVKSVRVKAFARDPRPRKRARRSDDLGAGEAGEFAGDGDADDVVIVIDVSELSDEELRELVEDLIEAADDIQDDIDDVVGDIADIDRKLADMTTPAGEREDLLDEREDLQDELDDLKVEQFAAGLFYGLAAQEYEKRKPGSVNQTLAAQFTWGFFPDPNEVAEDDARFFKVGTMGPYAADVNSPITSIKVVVPPNGSNPRHIIDQLCPTQLPTTQVTTTSKPKDTLVCSGGSLAVGASFRVHVKTSPAPTAGMGGQLFGQQDGAFKGPFKITGP